MVEERTHPPLTDKLSNLARTPELGFLKVLALAQFFRFIYKRGIRSIQDFQESFALRLEGKDDAPIARFSLATLGGDTRNKLNEDAPLVLPFGRHRMLYGALDGASSQRPISGLEAHGVNGAFYVSHLLSSGFGFSEQYKNLTTKDKLTAGDIMKAINSWLHSEMGQVEGIDYQDVLKIPGMAATLALVDYEGQEISIAHVADTMCIAEYTDGSYKIITPNQNKKFDDETIKLVEQLAKEKKISMREAAGLQEVRDQLAASFRKKINTPQGCGILNGMPELVENDLIFETTIPWNDNLHKLHLVSDGVIVPWIGRSNCSYDIAIRKFMGLADLQSIGLENAPREGFDQLDKDPDFSKIPRLKGLDDATNLTIDFSPQDTLATLAKQGLFELSHSSSEVK